MSTCGILYPKNVVDSMNCFKLTKIAGVFRLFYVFVTRSWRYITSIYITESWATELYYV